MDAAGVIHEPEHMETMIMKHYDNVIMYQLKDAVTIQLHIFYPFTS